MNKLSEENNKFAANNDKLEKEVSKMGEENNKMAENNKNLADEIARLKAQINRMAEENQKFAENNENLKAEVYIISLFIYLFLSCCFFVLQFNFHSFFL